MRRDRLVLGLLAAVLGVAFWLFSQLPIALEAAGCSGEYPHTIPNGCRGTFGVKCNKGYQGQFSKREILGKTYYIGKCVPGPIVRRG